jgi:hypothetical protein
LTGIKIPNSVTSIGSHAFGYCSGLESIVIPDSVKSIADYAFAYCRKLESIEIPNSVTSIANYAFAGCSKLESITINRSTSAGITALYVRVFEDCNVLANIYVPADSVSAYQNATNWSAHSGKIKAI